MFGRVLLIFLLFPLIKSQENRFPDCRNGILSTFPICNKTLTAEERVTDLIGRLTIDEKISRMITTTIEIDRLGLPSYEWWCEALHGLAFSACLSFEGEIQAATSFPMPINLGATFDTELVRQIGAVISTEARAFSNVGQGALSYFSPNINIFRDPRWGRGQETPGEDPFLTSQYVYAFVQSMQNGEDPRYLKIATTCKHFDAYDLENWNGTDRHHFDARVSDQDLVETYLQPFETCIKDAGVTSLMCSYNSINGIPACANTFLLQTIARFENVFQFENHFRNKTQSTNF